MPGTATPTTVANDRNAPLFAARDAAVAELEAAEAALAAGEPGARRSVRRARRAAEDAAAEIVTSNLGLVFTITRAFTARASAEDAADIEAAGRLGLMEAINTFQPGAGVFSSWAHRRIKAQVLRHIKATEYPTLSHSEFEKRPEILTAVEGLRAAGNEDPTHAEIAELAGVKVTQVERVLSVRRHSSLDATVGEDGDTTLGDLLVDDGPALDATAFGAMDAAKLLV